jgi:O-antigen ligase
MIDKWLTHYLLPAGLFIFLTAHFWAPERHNYKVIVNIALLAPALLSVLTFRHWRALSGSASLLVWVAAYLGYMVAISAWRGENAGDYAKWSLMILLFLFAVGLRLDMSLRAMQRLLSLAVVVAAAGAIFAVMKDWSQGLMEAPGYRMVGYGTMHNPLRTGHLFGAFALMGVWGALVGERAPIVRGLMWLSVLACVFALLMTGSRSPLIALFLAAAMLVLCGLQGRRRWLYLGLLGAAAVVVLLWFGDHLLARGLSLRPDIWSLVFGKLAEFPWFGHGLGTPLEIFLHTGEVYSDTHNLLLAVQYYGGVFGLLLFMAMFGRVFVEAWRGHKRVGLAGLAALLQIYGLATLQFDGGSLIGRPTEFWILYWLPVVLCVFAMQRARSGERRAD